MTEAPITLAAMVGIDWADIEHEFCVQERGTSERTTGTVAQKPEALAEWAIELKTRFGDRPVGVCLEQSRGALLYALSQYPWLVLYPINPHSLACYRKAFRPSGAKDDVNDAELLCDVLAKHQERLHPWKAEDPETRTLRLLLENRQKLVHDRTRLVSRLKATLKTYYPQALRWAGSLTKPMAWEFLLKWPRLDALKRVCRDRLMTFYHRHHVRRGELLDDAYDEIRRAVPLVTDTAIVDSAILMVQSICTQLHALQSAIDAHDCRIHALYVAHPESDLFQDLPGAGPVMGPRVLVAFGTDRERFADATEVQRLSGIAPVVERSGKSSWTHWRWAASTFLRQSFHEFALHSIGGSLWAKAYYRMQRGRGKDHHEAVRSLAFKWIRILFRCWHTRTPYDEGRYIESLRRRGSPLVALIDQRLAGLETA